MLSEKLNDYFDDKVVWLTGASSGIGRALTIALSEIDCEIFISSRSRIELEKTKELCAKQENIHILEGDLSNKESNQAICKQIKNQCDNLDIAILNAGTCEYVDIDQFDSALFRRLIDNNYMSMIYGIEASLPLLKNSKHAHLVGMSSTAAYLGLPRSEAYGASKAAIRNLFRALKVSLATYDIDVSVICPGFVKTELTDKNDFPMPCLISSQQASKEILNGIANNKHEIHFPKRFSYALKAISLLPDFIQFRIINKIIE
ncbi:MAG: SDR family NAD(P)-dependent oxidoreductase [Gammaproteobacteria bacterium]|nr:SDR family NAD(P)-dependent oxidoreductase [Gammaproteobacteria bacterium]